MKKMNITPRQKVEEDFMDYFNMTMEEFENLDYYTQEELIRKVSKLRNKLKKTEQGVHAKYRFGELFAYYPIETEKNIKEKIKSLFIK